MMKIPGLKETRKQPKSPKTISIYDNASGTSVDMLVPPSYKELLTLGRNWTNVEVQQIIKLQSKINNLGSAFSVKAFFDLWHKSEHICSITGASFSIFENFCIGIYRTNINQRYHHSNFKLMLLPLAYTLANYKRQKSIIESFDNYFTDKPLAKCVLQQLRMIIKNNAFLNSYFLEVVPLITNKSAYGMLFRSVIKNADKVEQFNVCEAYIDDVKTAICINNNGVCYYISLSDPTIDFREEFIRIFIKVFKSKLIVKSQFGCRGY